eukprot:CAMPEP_0194316152 /NCGR_PEP_ID=MMETSP0171-20130528/12970_1 /TAXON_ID=218684 /ORGANISM="Corethron pennatum, Strain L29A3" /LENGTH=58 /DNA_ID=CAMNT_0039072291 /DNA_START=33 /DNA_END=206 /DNA_ORIENTATION=+
MRVYCRTAKSYTGPSFTPAGGGDFFGGLPEEDNGAANFLVALPVEDDAVANCLVVPPD